MNLTAEQQDALIELINIGFGRAAASLSELTGHRVQLEVPQVTMCPIDEMSSLRPCSHGWPASTRFSGSGRRRRAAGARSQSAAISRSC